ncbi:MAG TPA: hypothetical protein VEC08_01115 [Nitrososphaerales archaeon]|nr:hypothetical protein [Nitrososphaerales archaeon]
MDSEKDWSREEKDECQPLPTHQNYHPQKLAHGASALLHCRLASTLVVTSEMELGGLKYARNRAEPGLLSVEELIDRQASNIENPVVLLSVNPVAYQKGVLGAVKYFSERFGLGLYITLNKPFASLQGAFDKDGLAPGSLVYLDSITNTAECRTKSCHFLGRMRELTDLCIALARMVSEEKGVKFVFVDSVSTLLIYNDSKSVARFCHSVTEKLRSAGLPAALVFVEMEEGKDVVAQLAQFCDVYVKAVS